MRPAAKVKEWLSQDEMMVWLQESPDKGAYQRRLAIWLTFAGRLHAHKVAGMLGVSVQAVWQWVSQYNTFGPRGLDRQGRGGRNWSFLGNKEEKELLLEILGRTEKGQIPETKEVKEFLEKHLGRKVSLSYVYKLLRRHNWPKVTRDVGAVRAEEEFAHYSTPWQRWV